MKSLLFITLLLFSTSSWAFNNDLFLKGGLSLGGVSIETLDDLSKKQDPNNDLDESHSVFASFGLNSSFGYMLTDWEFSGYSAITFGKVKDLSIFAGGDIIEGSGSYRSVAIGPLVKYYTPFKIKKDWKLYFGIGPTWSIQTITMERFHSVKGTFTDNQKLAIESFGFTFVVGLHEQVLFKEMHPVFFELVYSHRNSYKISTVDASKFTETNVLTTDEKGQEIEDTMLLLNMGIVFF